jgi:hypothetical protein
MPHAQRKSTRPVRFGYVGLFKAEDPADGTTRRFDFYLGDTFVDVSDPLTDDDSMCLLVASANTLRKWTSRRTRCCGLEPLDTEGPKYHPGPPFPVGDVILADVGNHRLQQAFVIKSHHPEYRLRLEDGTTVATNMQDLWLTARMSGMAPDRDDPFVKIRKEVEAGPLKMGSYGVHGNAQRESLRLVEEAKAYARAVKADDAEVPTHLRDDRISAPEIPKEQQDRALAGLRKLGFQWFWRVLMKDCAAFVRKRHGEHWREGGRRQDGKGPLTELGKDLRAIASMLWHANHTTWFEFNTGSWLVHFRFPEKYRREARDGVKAFFERPGLTA